MPRDRGEGGQYVETVTLDGVLDTFDEVEGPVVLSADVADRVGCSRETARRKLKELYEDDILERRRVARRVIYWRPEEGGETAATEHTDASEEPPAREHNAARARESTGPSLRDRVEGLDIPGSGSRLEDRREALVAVLEHLRERGQATARELKDVLDEYPHGYESAESFWSNLRTKNALAELEVVETPGQGGKLYRYREPEGGEDRGVA